MLGVQGNIVAVAVAEKRDVVQKFLEFLEERGTPIDVVIRKYRSYNFVSFSQAVQCIVGQLLKHIISPSDALLNSIFQFSFEETVLRINSHPLFDYFCFLHCRSQLTYVTYQGSWDVLLAFRSLQTYFTVKPIQTAVLRVLFQHVCNVDVTRLQP